MEGLHRDAAGKTTEERFTEIRAHFLECLKLGGISRTDLYYRPKQGDAREPTEQEVVWKWADTHAVPVNDILVGITRAFEFASGRGDVVTSFRYCVPHIVNRVQETANARAARY